MDEATLVHNYLNRTDGVMLDVGASLGHALRPFARSGWQVWAFEPDEQNRRRLLDSVEPGQEVHVDPLAFSERPETGKPFFRSELPTGISSLYRFHETHASAGTVDVTTLAEFCSDKGIEKVDFLKIDAEGSDLFILKGNDWSRCRPEIILAEFEDAKTVDLGYTWRDLGQYLLDQGYRVVVSEWYPIVRYGTRHRWRRFASFPCELADPEAGWGNLLAFREAPDTGRLMQASCHFRPNRGLPPQAASDRKGASMEKHPKPSKSGGRHLAEVAREIVRWHLKWPGLALLVTLALTAWALSGRMGAFWASLAAVVVIFATMGFVFVRARAEAREAVRASHGPLSEALSDHIEDPGAHGR